MPKAEVLVFIKLKNRSMFCEGTDPQSWMCPYSPDHHARWEWNRRMICSTCKRDLLKKQADA